MVDMPLDMPSAELVATMARDEFYAAKVRASDHRVCAVVLRLACVPRPAFDGGEKVSRAHALAEAARKLHAGSQPDATFSSSQLPLPNDAWLQFVKTATDPADAVQRTLGARADLTGPYLALRRQLLDLVTKYNAMRGKADEAAHREINGVQRQCHEKLASMAGAVHQLGVLGMRPNARGGLAGIMF